MEKVEEDETKSDVAKEFKIPLSTLSAIIKHKEKIVAQTVRIFYYYCLNNSKFYLFSFTNFQKSPLSFELTRVNCIIKMKYLLVCHILRKGIMVKFRL